jgi:hypothetical protein
MFVALTGTALANTIPPGTNNAPPDTLTAGGSLLATMSGSFLFAAPPPATFSGTYTTWVYSDPGNKICAGCLDFVYQVSNTTKNPLPPDQGIIERITASAFAGFTTDVGYTPGTGAVAPDGVSRSSSPGNVVGWNFLGTNLDPNQTSDLLVIETNAKFFGMGTISAQDGTAGSALGFAPSAVPEPMTMGLLGGGLALLGVARLRRKNKS